MLIAQITDFHIGAPGKKVGGQIDTADFLKRAVAHVNALDPQPEVVLATGDLANVGTADEYRYVRELLAPITLPLYVIPGNHDNRETMRAAFSDHAYLPREGFLQYAIDDYPLRLIALDTLIQGEEGGELRPESLAWLEARLAEARDKPTVVIMHHQPFWTGMHYMDNIGLADPAAFRDVIARHNQVERVLCGHMHRAIETRFAGTVATTCPSTAHQVALDLRPNVEAAWTYEPPGFQLHLWRAETGLVSHTAYIGDFAPHAF